MKKVFITLLLFCFYVAQGAHGAMIIQQFTAASSWDIEDSYGSDTTSDYTVINTGNADALSVESGVLRTGNELYSTAYYHETNLSSDVQMVQAVLCDGASTTNRSAIVLRSDGTTSSDAHVCSPDVDNARIECRLLPGNSGGTWVYFSTWGGTWTQGDCHLVRVTVDASNEYHSYIDFNDDLDFDDANEDDDTATNSTLDGNTYAGVGFIRNSVTDDVYLDDFKAKAND